MSRVKATIRIERDGSPLLVFHGVNDNGRVEFYSRREGHGECLPQYIKTATTRMRDDDKAQGERLVSHYADICRRHGDELQVTAIIDWTLR